MANGTYYKGQTLKQQKKISLYLMALLYVAAGINHFLNPKIYLGIMPPFLPQPLLLVYISGLFEVLLGLLLLVPATRTLAAWGIIVLLLAVFPANIQMAVNYLQTENPRLWLALLRLPLQGMLIWWAWQFTRK
jgi:uncharacterized membrane protein